MISVRINNMEREGIDESWLARTINGLRKNGGPICVRIKVKTSELDLMVSAGECGTGGGGGRQPTQRERAILNHWADCESGNELDLDVGRLMKCLKQLERDV